MYNNRKYSPTRFIDSQVTVTFVNKSPVTRRAGGSMGETEDCLDCPPCIKMRQCKGKVVKAVRIHPASQAPSLESIEAVWSQKRPHTVPIPSARKPAEPESAPAPRGRRKGYRPPDVRTIFSPSRRDPRVMKERGEGHHFIQGVSAAWCDVCCQYILHRGLICTGCKYTCHPDCRDLVTLDCHPGGSPASDPQLSPLSQDPLSQDHLNNNSPLIDVEKDRELRSHLSREDIKLRVEQYNASSTDHLRMTLNPSGVYTGFIKVQLELRRPVTVRGGAGGGARGEAGGEEAFYLPRGSTNTLHISSNNTVKQVIQALLNKFTVADNPAKYALYKRYRREDQVYVCRLAEGEQPLFLRLLAGPDTDTLSFVLREQQTGEVMWDAFSIPELSNFLRILEKEEEEQVSTITRRYDNYRVRLQEALSSAGAPV